MAKRAGNRSFLTSMMIDNWKNKGVALFLALVVWAFAFGSTQEEQKLTAVIRLNKGDNVAIKSASVVHGDEMGPGDKFVFRERRGSATQVKIVLSGQRRVIQNLVALIGTLEIRDEITEYRLDDPAIYRDLPQGVLIKSVDPAVIRVETELVVSEPKVIRFSDPIVSGRPGEGRAATPTSVTTDPKELELVGPQSAIDRVRLTLQPVPVDGVEKQLYETRAVVEIEDESGTVRFANGVEPEVAVQIKFDDQTVKRSFKVQVVFSHGASETPITVAVEGEREAVFSTIFRGTARGLDALESAIADGSFFFVCPVKFQAEPQAVSKDLEDFFWPHDSLPEGVTPLQAADDQRTFAVRTARTKQ
ncbi:MAG: hypothetical protein AAF581_16320 [Planctomycetota bacterium]